MHQETLLALALFFSLPSTRNAARRNGGMCLNFDFFDVWMDYD